VTNLFTSIESVAVQRGTALAFDCGESPGAEQGRDPGATPGVKSRFSYAEVLSRSAQFAAALDAAGVGVGDRVTVQLDKHIDVVWLYLAVLRRGAVYVPLNTGYTDAELSYFIEDARPRLVVVEAARIEALSKLVDNLTSGLTTAQDTARIASLDDLRRDAARASSDQTVSPPVDRGDDDLAAILYTSGTTGRSKGAMLSHGNLASNAMTLIDAWGFSADDVLLHTLPIYHVHGLFVALHCALLSGAATLFAPRFDVAEVLAQLPRATVFMGVPTYYTRLLKEAAFPSADITPRLYVSGSAPLRTETFADFEQRTGQRILERYGMTEAGMICSNPLHGERIAGTVGPPLAGIDVRVAETGAPGVLEITGPNVFQGYWENAEKTAESFTDDGYFITGDLATIDADGIVSIVGRDKDLIISGGLNVYPKEIETTLDAIGTINESAVIGLNHPDFGEAVVAVIDATAGCPDEATLIATLKQTLAGFKVPKRVLRIEALPRNAMGKVQKNLLREQFATLFEQ
jgi:malonyl-CoA/methylmalonyl-CoA synthetase